MENQSIPKSELKRKGKLEFILDDNSEVIPACSSILSIPKIELYDQEIKWFIDEEKCLRLSDDSVKLLQSLNIIYFVDVRIHDPSESTIHYQMMTVSKDSKINLDIVKPVDNKYKVDYEFLDQFESERNFWPDISSNHFFPDLLPLLSDGLYADFTLNCQGGTLKAHKCILATKSSFFKKVIDEGSRDISCSFDIKVMKAILEFIYSGLLNSTVLQGLLLAADFYELTDLKSKCEFHLTRDLNKTNVISSLIFAHQNKTEFLKKAALKHLKTYSKAIVINDELSKITDQVEKLELEKLILGAMTPETKSL